jgi:hypothetical protein
MRGLSGRASTRNEIEVVASAARQKILAWLDKNEKQNQNENTKPAL